LFRWACVRWAPRLGFAVEKVPLGEKRIACGPFGEERRYAEELILAIFTVAEMADGLTVGADVLLVEVAGAALFGVDEGGTLVTGCRKFAARLV
jgi:hypothetical protein